MNFKKSRMKILIVSAVIITLSFTSFAQVGIGTQTPEISSILEIKSTTKGFLLPRMTQTQMRDVDSPVQGLMVYCTNCPDEGGFVYNGTSFVNASTGKTPSADLVATIVAASSSPPTDGIPSLADLLNAGITGAIGNQIYYELAIAEASPVPSTLEDLQAIIDEVIIPVWGEVRYIMFRGTAGNNQYNNVGEVDILDIAGNNLIDNGTLNKSNFIYRYGGGYYNNQGGTNLFNNVVSSAYANAQFSTNSSGEKWVLVDLGETVDVGTLKISARSTSTSHINRIKHITIFTSSTINDDGFAYSGTETNTAAENLQLGSSIDDMKAVDSSLKWKTLDEFSTSNSTIDFDTPE